MSTIILGYALTALAVFIGCHASYWAVSWELRGLAWWHMPKCVVCKERCRQVFLSGNSKPAPMCEFHLREAIEMHANESRSRATAEDREGEEWKDGAQE